MQAPRLSQRHAEVLGYIFVGKTNEEIGTILGLSVLTIKNHVGKIIAALGAYNRQNAIWLALKAGILQPPQPEGQVVVVVPPPAPPATVTADDWLSAGNVHLSPMLHFAMANDRPLELAGVRFRLLEAFLRSPGRCLTRQHLLDHTHGHAVSVEERTVYMHVHRLRHSLREAGADHDVFAERGVGYRFGPVLSCAASASASRQ